VQQKLINTALTPVGLFQIAIILENVSFSSLQRAADAFFVYFDRLKK